MEICLQRGHGPPQEHPPTFILRTLTLDTYGHWPPPPTTFQTVSAEALPDALLGPDSLQTLASLRQSEGPSRDGGVTCYALLRCCNGSDPDGLNVMPFPLGGRARSQIFQGAQARALLAIPTAEFIRGMNALSSPRPRRR